MSMLFLNRLACLDRLIRIKGTGNPKQLAEKLNISERTLYEYIEVMKQLGAPIKYSKTRRTYYYQEDGEFYMAFLKNQRSTF